MITRRSTALVRRAGPGSVNPHPPALRPGSQRDCPGSAPYPGAKLVAARPRAKSALIFLLTDLSWLLVAGILGVHVVLGAEPFSIAARALCAVPAVLFFIEARTYVKSEERELPFILLALGQYYLQFGFPVFWDVPFFDTTGPVFLSEAVHTQACIAVALGAVSFWGVARFALPLGHRLRRSALKILPPETIPSGWDTSFYIYTGAIVAYALAPIPFPVSISMVGNLLLDSGYAMGLAAVRPPLVLGRRASQVLLLIGMSVGVLRGTMEPIARTVIAYLGAQWVTTRRAALGALSALVVIYAVLQPVKASYRNQVWGDREEVSLSGRVQAWESALSNTQRHSGDEAIGRLSEISAVMHAFVVVPSRIDYMYGETYAEILYSPIPRLIWPDKPDSSHQYSQRYSVIFGLQTETGSETTAMNLNPLVEGYWNFGWFGIALGCAAMGLVVGAQQRLFAGSHWALFAGGVAQLCGLTMTASTTNMCSLLFQCLAARVMSAWVVYWLARSLSNQRARGGVTHRLARRGQH